jgi:hypothetical protein
MRASTSRTLATVVSVALIPAAGGTDVGIPLDVTVIENPEPTASASFGAAAAGLGDMNGDGVGDLAVASLRAGVVWILSGTDGATLRAIVDPQELSGTLCEPTEGDANPCLFGLSIAGVGDVDADGVDDIAVGAPGPIGTVAPPCIPNPNDECLLKGGRVELFSGATGAPMRTLPRPDFTPTEFGVSIVGVGDVDGDGMPEFTIGHAGGFFGGGLTLVSLSATTGILHWTVAPQLGGDFDGFARNQASIGDVTGDGWPDFLVAAPAAGDDARGLAYVVSGADGGIVRAHANPDPADGGRFGAGVGRVGDLTGDGVAEYAVAEAGEAPASASLVHLFDGAGGWPLRSLPSPVEGLDGGSLDIAGTGDYDGDSLPDLWVGGAGSGAAVLMTATGSTLATQTDPLGGPFFGSVVAPVGPLAPGSPDILVGAPGHVVAGLESAGAVFLLRRNRPPDCAGVTISADALWPPNHRFEAATLSGATDPDGDAVTISVTSIRQDEPVGRTAPDGMGLGTGTALLRVERDGSGDGRVYRVGFTATAQGGTCTGTISIGVDHDRRGLPAVDGGPLHDSTGG